MFRSTLVFLVTLTLVLSFSACGGKKKNTSSSAGSAAPVARSHGSEGLNWSSDWDASLEKARNENKRVLVDFYADWCVWCKKLEKTTLSDGAVAAYLKERVVPLRLDVDSNGRARSREFRIDGLPTLLILNADGREIGRIPGYLPPDAFLQRVQSLLGS